MKKIDSSSFLFRLTCWRLVFQVAKTKRKFLRFRQRSLPLSANQELEDEAWHMEELYWEYVQNSDTVTYKTTLAYQFYRLPEFWDGVSDKSKDRKLDPWFGTKTRILKYSYKLHKKRASNAIEDVVISVFMILDYFDQQGKIK